MEILLTFILFLNNLRNYPIHAFPPIYRYFVSTKFKTADFPVVAFSKFSLTQLMWCFNLTMIPGMTVISSIFPHSHWADLRSTVFISRQLYSSTFICFQLHPLRSLASYFLIFSPSSAPTLTFSYNEAVTQRSVLVYNRLPLDYPYHTRFLLSSYQTYVFHKSVHLCSATTVV